MTYPSNVDSATNATTTSVRVFNMTLRSRSLNADAVYDHAALIRPSDLAACCQMNGSLAVYVRLTDLTVSGLADAILLAGTNLPPTLETHSAIDLSAWQSHCSVHEFAFTISQPSDIVFVSAANGRCVKRERLTIAVVALCPTTFGA
jgi:hypothetical protein